MASRQTIANDGSEAIARVAAVKTGDPTHIEDLNEKYDIVETLRAINDGNFKSVALQFPDELLSDSALVASQLQKSTTSRIFILGDTSYASCCIDEVAAEHLQADLIVHYGRSCLSRPSRIPALFVFGRMAIDVEQCSRYLNYVLEADSSRAFIVLYDVTYTHAINAIQTLTKPNRVIFSSIDSAYGVCQPQSQTQVASSSAAISSSAPPSSTLPSLSLPPSSSSSASPEVAQQHHFFQKFGRKIALEKGKKLEDYNIFYIGAEGPTLTHFIMSFNRCQFYSFDPNTNIGRKETLNVNKALMRRYYLVQKAKDVNIFGIVFGTLGVANYLEIVDALQKIIKKAGKRYYTFCVGKLNPPKLANFAEVEMYVLVACPETSLVDSQEFYRPIISPFELAVACSRQREWTGEYETDFAHLLPGLSADIAFKPSQQQEGDEDEEADFSLITGSYRSKAADRSDDSSTSLATRNDQTALTSFSSAGEFFGNRTFKGLEQRIGETPVVKAVEGMTGVASGYNHEPPKAPTTTTSTSTTSW